MVDPTTTNRGYAIPTRGSDPGTWDVPVNGDFTLIDQNLGAVTTVPLTNANVALNAAQYACGTIRFTGTLTADVQVTFPLVSGWWTVDNQTTGNFVVQLVCNPGGRVIGVPQAVASDVFTDGANIGFRNLPEVGSYKDYAGSVSPRWVGFCTVAPWLLCDGSAFNAVTYPILAQILGGTTLPDFRGRGAFFLNGATTRLTSAGAGIDGNTIFASGGANGITLITNQLPAHTHANTLNDPGHIHTPNPGLAHITGQPVTTGNASAGQGALSQGDTSSAVTGITITNASTGAGANIPNVGPGIVGGIRLIRAG